MAEYTPHGWVILKGNRNGKNAYKVFAAWSGGFLEGDTWRVNSGITSMKEEGDYYKFYGYSGSVYKCIKGEGYISIPNLQILSEFLKQEGVSMISFEDFKEEFCL